jgi:GT2 family glycosyltransferase/glycosyltransferase involved in cell wall biosynthesis
VNVRDDNRDALDVLVTSSYYWPEKAGNAPYVTGVAEHLAARGHRVVVATGFPHYPEWRSSGRGILGTRELHNCVEIRRRRHFVPQTQSATTRALYEASLCSLGLTALPRKRPDAIIGISPTLAGALVARTAATLYRRPYGLVFQDLQGVGALQSGVEGGRRIASLVERAELALARDAIAVGVIASGFRTYFEVRGISANAIHDLRNWSHDVRATEDPATARARLGWRDDQFVCLHAGNMGLKQGLENVLQAAALIEDPAVSIVLAGDGNERLKLEALAADMQLRNVTFLPSQPSGAYESMLRAADVLLVNQRATVGEMSLASKLTSYFVAGRPIVAAVASTSETARELLRAGAGILAAPEDPRALARTICSVKAGVDPELGEKGRRYAESNLSAEAVLEGYERFVRTVSRGESSTKRRRRSVGSASSLPAAPEHHEPTARRAGQEPGAAIVSVIVVSYQSRAALATCLASLADQPSALPIEVIVVDNASSDGAPEFVRQRFPWVRLVANGANVGFARAANQGIALATGSDILLLNPDTVVPVGGLQAAHEELERHPDVGILGCKLVRPDGTFDHACKRGIPTISSALAYFFRLHRLRPRSPRFSKYVAGELGEDEAGYVDAVNGAFMLVRKEAAEAVGPLDERYWMYAEDLDWCRRFWEAGWKVLYWPGIQVTHWKGGSSGDVRPWRLNWAFHRSMWQFYEKHEAPKHGRPLSAAVRVGIWAKFAASSAVTAIRRPPAHGWSSQGTSSESATAARES